MSHGFVNHSKPILDSVIKNNPPDQVVKFVIKSCEKDLNFNSSRKCLKVFDCVICLYCEYGLCLKGLEVFNFAKCLDKNELFSVGLCNTLLNSLQENDEVELGLCFLGVVIRHGVLIDQFTWLVIARLLKKQRKVDGMIRIIDTGIHDSVIYDLVIECCSEMGMFEIALHMFDEMSKRKLSPGFNTFASILNGACRYKNDEKIKFAMESMVEKGYVSKTLTGRDLLIRKLCDIRKTYAAQMLFKTACDVQSSLESETYGCMLRALSMEARVEDAIETYHFIEKRRIQVNPSLYNEFINVLCNEDLSKEVSSLLVNMISRGYKPSPMALSKYIISQCKKRRWQESEELANLALQESICLDASCCGCLVKHYCNKGRVDLAIKMHDQMEKKELTLDSKTYNALLTGLLDVPMVKDAERIFDYMRINNLLVSESFVIMINGFFHDNELKKAMKLHDEMLEMGLKPSTKMYKQLICNFR
uniref:pentatricopeptide repeat-containing protein At4g21170 n=1 Tax=Erigeron canadensis TaxID=72917 RepID=UPI001CB8942D|nr:pentatricopeptide repeat-containing protein At4g21170 [Erigeron canadensis]